MQTTMRKLFILLTMACAFMFAISCDELGLGDKNGNGVEAITFTDDEVKQICIANWDTNEDGELSHEEAAAITDLGDAFKGAEISSFDELKHFTSLKTIAEDAFYGCSDLKSITIPKNVSEIKLCAFYDCASLKSITIPKSVSGIEAYAFYGCSSLTSVTIPDNVIKIEYGVFRNCSGMKSFSGKFASDDNRCLIVDGALNSFAPAGLTTYTIPNEVTVIGVGAFEGYSKLTSVTIPDSVTEIEFMAFSGCSALNSITIPKGVTFIDEYAFEDCASLTSVYCMPTTPPEIGEEVFINHSPDLTIFVPKGCAAKYKAQWSEWENMIAENNGNNDDVAENQKIYYTATEKVEPDYTASFGANIVSNDFDSTTGQGVITFDNIVTKVGEEAFRSNLSLTSIALGDGVTEIGNGAFAGCRNLTSVTIPSSVTTIKGSAFSICTSLTSITIPDNVTEIGSSAFSQCYELQSVSIGNGITKISNSLFSSCNKLTDVSLTDNITEIGENAFNGCSSLTTFTIPNSVTAISANTFKGCRSLTAINIHNKITSIGYGAFNGCNGLQSVTIGNSVTKIEGYAFAVNNVSLASLTIPESVTEIGNKAFSGMTVDELTINGAVVEAPFTGLFWHTDFTFKKLTIGGNITKIGERAFAGCKVETLEILNGVTAIESNAFYNCGNLTSVTMPSSITIVYAEAFKDCGNVKRVDISDLAAWCKTEFRGTLANPIFYNNAKLYLNNKEITELTIPSNVTAIKAYAFAGCSNSLKSVTIPKNVTEIGREAFRNCNTEELIINSKVIETDYSTSSNAGWHDYFNFKKCAIGESVTSLGNKAFYWMSSMTSITIPNTISKIGNEVFYNCSGLKEVYCEPTTPPTIGERVFTNNSSELTIHVPKGCSAKYKAQWGEWEDMIADDNGNTAAAENRKIYYTAIEKVEPNSYVSFGANIVSNDFDSNTGKGVITFDNIVTTFGTDAFRNRNKLTSIIIPNKVTEIGSFAFNNCDNLTSVTIGNSVTKINNKAFYYCAGLTSIIIPNNVTEIGIQAFYLCVNLTNVTIGNSVTLIGSEAFQSCEKLTSVTIPNNVTEIGNGAFTNCDNLKSFYGKFASDDNRCLIVNEELNSFAPAGLTTYTIPNNVTEIGNYAFYCCSNLTSITIPNSVTAIGDFAFYGCNLTSFYGKFASNDNRCLIVDGVLNAFARAGLTTYTIPDSVTEIGEYVFTNCTSLTSISIPDSVVDIGHRAFEGCIELTSVYCKPKTPPTTGRYNLWDAFGRNASDRKIYVPQESVEAYKNADGWSNYADAIVGYDF